MQLQLLHTVVLAPIDYLLSMLTVDYGTQERIDRHQRRFARKIFCLPRNTPDAVVMAVSALNPIIATLSRDRERLVTQTADPLYPDTSLAYAVLQAMESDAKGRSNSVANLVARWSAKRARINSQLGVSLAPTAPPPHRVAIETALFGDRVGQQRWRHNARVTAGIHDPREHRRALRSSSQSAPQPSLYIPRVTAVAHAADIYFQYSQPLNCPVELHGRPPLSLHGPSGTSLVALCNLPCRAVSSVARLQTGDLALQRYPWRPRTALRTSEMPRQRGSSGTGVEGDDNEFSDADDSSTTSSLSEAETTQQCTSDSGTSDCEDSDCETIQRCPDASDTDSSSEGLGPHSSLHTVTISPARSTSRTRGPARRKRSARRRPVASAPRSKADHSQFVSHERQCRLCGTGFEHPYHFFFECNAGGFPELREPLLRSAALQYWRVLSSIGTAVYSEDHVEATGLSEAGAALKTVFSCGLASAEAVWLTHRLLWALPWAARNVPSSATAALALGLIFDDTVLSRHALRPLADSWVGWSVGWTRRFGDEWARQLARAGATGSAAGTRT